MRYLSSNKNIAGTAIALCVLGAYGLGLIHAFWWELALAGYGAAALAVPDARAAGAVAIEEDAATALRRARGVARRSLTPDLRARVDAIAEIVSALLPTLERDGTASELAQTLTRTATRYLPDTIARYERIPPPFRDRPGAEGRTPHELIAEQLEFLEKNLAETAANAAQGDVAALATNGDFLRRRFGSDGDLLPPEGKRP